MKKNVKVAAPMALGVAALVGVLVWQLGDSSPKTAETADGSNNQTAGGSESPDSLSPKHKPAAISSRTVHAASRARDETTPQEWPTLSPEARITLLQSEYNLAIKELEQGDSSAKQRATDALTALRFELYETPEGRERHAALEARLEKLGGDV